MRASSLSVLALSSLGAFVLAQGCMSMTSGPTSGPSEGPNKAQVTGDNESACVAALPLQNTRAFALGETYYLPAPTGAADCAAKTDWELVRAPEGSTNRVYEEGAAAPRFTPDVTGVYEFRSKTMPDLTATLTVVARSNADRFQNHYLTPLFAEGWVGDELWVANGAAYSVTRLANKGGTLEKVGETPAGVWPAAVAWRDPLPYAIVAQRGSDTVGFMDRTRGVLEDALWVGDEPVGLAISPDAKTLYVSLATERAVAIVNLEKRVVEGRIEVGFDPRAMALSADGARLFVASYRSANLQNGPGGSRPAADDKDVFIIDTATRTVSKIVNTVSADLRAMALTPEGDELFIAATDGDTIPPQTDLTAKPFVHEVVTIASDPGSASFATVGRRVDLSRQKTSTGNVVNPAGVLVTKDIVWVASESSSMVVGLDRQTLEEKFRVPVGDGARHIVAFGDGVAVHCYQSFEVWVLGPDGSVRQTVKLTDDPRPTAVALGEKVFTRPGGNYATNHSCSSCHIETQNDGMVWRFGPKIWHNVRPLQLLASTTPLEWGAYMSSSANFGHAGPTSIVSRPSTTEEANGLGAFLDSLIGAPRATGHTRLDGSYSSEALAGKELFEGKAGCTNCHAPPLYTNRTLIEKGKSGEPADVPSLLGVYRHGVYMVKGQARSLTEAVDVAANYVGVDLDSKERQSIVRFLSELTPKGAAPLGIFPDIESRVANVPTVAPWVEFAEPIDDSIAVNESAAKFVTLEDDDKNTVDTSVEVAGLRITLRPKAPLARGKTYRMKVASGLPFRSGGALEAPRTTKFTIAGEAASVTLENSLVLTISFPMRQADGSVKEMPLSFPVDFTPSATEDSRYTMDLNNGAKQTRWIRFDGSKVYLEPFALPTGRGIANASSVEGTVDEQGVVRGTLTVGAPGVNVPGTKWELAPKK